MQIHIRLHVKVIRLLTVVYNKYLSMCPKAYTEPTRRSKRIAIYTTNTKNTVKSSLKHFKTFKSPKPDIEPISSTRILPIYSTVKLGNLPFELFLQVIESSTYYKIYNTNTIEWTAGGIITLNKLLSLNDCVLSAYCTTYESLLTAFKSINNKHSMLLKCIRFKLYVLFNALRAGHCAKVSLQPNLLETAIKNNDNDFISLLVEKHGLAVTEHYHVKCIKNKYNCQILNKSAIKCHELGAIMTFKTTCAIPGGNRPMAIPIVLRQYLLLNLHEHQHHLDIKLLVACYYGNRGLIDYYLSTGMRLGPLELECATIGGNVELWQEIITSGVITLTFDTLIRLFFSRKSTCMTTVITPSFVFGLYLKYMTHILTQEDVNYMFHHICVNYNDIMYQLFDQLYSTSLHSTFKTIHVDFAIQHGALKVAYDLSFKRINCSSACKLHPDILHKLKMSMTEPTAGHITQQDILVLLRTGYLAVCEPAILHSYFVKWIVDKNKLMLNHLLSHETSRTIIYQLIMSLSNNRLLLSSTILTPEKLFISFIEALY